MRAIVTDERRCDGPKGDRRFAVALESPGAALQHLHGATSGVPKKYYFLGCPSPRCVLLLAPGLLRAITVTQVGRKPL